MTQASRRSGWALGLLLAVLAAPTFAPPLAAHDVKAGELVIVAPWARATLGGGKTGVAYLTVVNRGAAADRLLAVATPVAAKAELHTHVMDGDVMKMRPVQAIEVAAQGSTELAPGGDHVMLMGLERPLEEGAAFPMTLTFESAGTVEVEVHVESAAAMGPAEMSGSEHAGHARAHGSEEHGGEQHGGHGHGETVSLPSGPDAPSLDFTLAEDAVGGWNLHIVTRNFRFAPEQVNGANEPGTGHAHLYVNGEKIARVYAPWFHLGSLPAGRNEVTVTLNANDHSPLAVGWDPLSVTETVVAP